jgi:hypothetical protein
LDRADISELYYIVPRENLPSILEHGIVSNVRAARLEHSSVAMAVIQQRRDHVRVPGARSLHEYVNLYVCARNPMMYRLVMTNGASRIAVLGIDATILDTRGAVIADGNAASGYTRFAPSPDGIKLIDHALVHGDWSGYQDEREKWEHKRVKCAEVLVPDRVAPDLVSRVLVPVDAAIEAVVPLAGGRPVVAAPDVFFGVS